MNRVSIILLALLLHIAGVCSGQTPLHLAAGVTTNVWTVCNDGNVLLSYTFSPRQCKPYVAEFSAPVGRNILRDAPPDHPWHHGLMYAIKVNDVNFWEENSGNGVQRVVETSATASGNVATLSQVIHWVMPQDAFMADTKPFALLIEHRTLVLTVDSVAHESALEWRAEFEVGTKTNEVRLAGANYHGLGMRFLAELDRLAEHSYAGRKPDLTNEHREFSPAKWAAVTFAAPDYHATIALMPDPANARGDGEFFAMKTGFSYLAATQGLDLEPLVYRSGEKFALRYLLVLYPEVKSTKSLEARDRRWRESGT